MSFGYGVLLTPLQILSFYNAVANEGEMLKPTFLESTNKFGSSNKNQEFKKSVLNPAICSKNTLATVQQMLYDVINHENGTAKNIRSNNVKIAGKTGTTQNHSDGWYMGVTPNLVVGVWTGCEDRSAHFRDIYYGQGANMALPVYAEYLKRVYADTSRSAMYTEKFNIPSAVDLKLDCGESIFENDNSIFEEQ